jgi:hypothetical protein
MLAVALAVAGPAGDELGVGSLRLVSPPPPPDPAEAELYVTLSGGLDTAPGERAFSVSQDVVAAQLEADPAIVAVRVVQRGDRVILIADFGSASSAEREDAADRLPETIDSGALRATVEGEAVRIVEAREKVGDELWRKELIAVPLALLVLVAAAGIRGVAAPLLCAGLAIAGTLALLRLAGLAADLSLLGFAVAAPIGLVLGVELALRALRSPVLIEGDNSRALFVAAVAGLPGFALLVTPLDQAASLALGAGLAGLFAVAASRLVVPAVVALYAKPATGERDEVERTSRWPRLRPLAAVLGLLALCALVVPAFVYGTTAPYTALDPAFGPWPPRAAGDSLFGELPLAAGIAAVAVALALAWLARSPLALALGPLSLLPAAAALGVCALLADAGEGFGRSDPAGTFFDTGAAAVCACAIAAISCGRSALAANAFFAGRRLELMPALAATAVGLLGAAGLYAVDLDQAGELAIGLAVGLVADVALLRLPLSVVGARWVGSRP